MDHMTSNTSVENNPVLLNAVERAGFSKKAFPHLVLSWVSIIVLFGLVGVACFTLSQVIYLYRVDEYLVEILIQYSIGRVLLTYLTMVVGYFMLGLGSPIAMLLAYWAAEQFGPDVSAGVFAMVFLSSIRLGLYLGMPDSAIDIIVLNS